MFKFVDFFHIRKVWRSMKRNKKTLLEIFAYAGVPIIHSIGFFPARSKYH